MIRNLVRIVRWAGPYRARLFWGCVCSFFMTWAVAAPVVLAAWLLAQVADDARGVSQLDPSGVWLSLLAMVGCVLARFAFSYGKNRLQESIGYEVAAQERIDLGNVLKRVPLGYFAQNKTGDILATATTELGVLELQGMKMVDAVINGYVNLAAIVWFLFVLSPPAALAAVAASLLLTVHDLTGAFAFVEAAPLYAYGFAWLLPSLIGGVAGALLGRRFDSAASG